MPLALARTATIYLNPDDYVGVYDRRTSVKCWLTKHPCDNPVVVRDDRKGVYTHFYEAGALNEYFQRHGLVDPVTGNPVQRRQIEAVSFDGREMRGTDSIAQRGAYVMPLPPHKALLLSVTAPKQGLSLEQRRRIKNLPPLGQLPKQPPQQNAAQQRWAAIKQEVGLQKRGGLWQTNSGTPVSVMHV